MTREQAGCSFFARWAGSATFDGASLTGEAVGVPTETDCATSRQVASWQMVPATLSLADGALVITRFVGTFRLEVTNYTFDGSAPFAYTFTIAEAEGVPFEGSGQ